MAALVTAPLRSQLPRASAAAHPCNCAAPQQHAHATARPRSRTSLLSVARLGNGQWQLDWPRCGFWIVCMGRPRACYQYSTFLHDSMRSELSGLPKEDYAAGFMPNSAALFRSLPHVFQSAALCHSLPLSSTCLPIGRSLFLFVHLCCSRDLPISAT